MEKLKINLRNLIRIYRSKRKKQLHKKAYSDVYFNRGMSNKFFNLPISLKKTLEKGDIIEKKGIQFVI